MEVVRVGNMNFVSTSSYDATIRALDWRMRTAARNWRSQ